MRSWFRRPDNVKDVASRSPSCERASSTACRTPPEFASGSSLIQEWAPEFCPNARNISYPQAHGAEVRRSERDVQTAHHQISGSPFFDTEQAAGYLKLSTRTLERWRQTGGGPK